MSGSVVRRSEMSPVLWGDEQSGYASDTFFYVGSEMAVLIATIPPGKRFTASENYRAIFSSDEALYVLTGEYTIQDPETGEVKVGRPGDTIVIKGPQWHFGYNFSESALRIFEVVAPVDISNSMGHVPIPDPIKGYLPEQLLDFPAVGASSAQRTYLTRPDTCAYVLQGTANPVRLDVLCSTPRVALVRLDLLPGQRSDVISFNATVVVVATSGIVFVREPEEGSWNEVPEGDAVVFQAGDKFALHNQAEQKATCLIAISGNLGNALMSAGAK